MDVPRASRTVVVVRAADGEPLCNDVGHIGRGAIVPQLVRRLAPLLEPALVLRPCQRLARVQLRVRGRVRLGAVVAVACVDGLRRAVAVAHDPRDVEGKVGGQLAAPGYVCRAHGVVLILNLHSREQGNANQQAAPGP